MRRFVDSFGQVLAAMWAHKLRSFLTMFGIAWGVGSLLLLVGFLTRLAALGIGCVMAAATLMVHSKVGFFMNWAGMQKGEGFEYHLLALGLCIAVLIKGAGALSVDRALSREDGASAMAMPARM